MKLAKEYEKQSLSQITHPASFLYRNFILLLVSQLKVLDDKDVTDNDRIVDAAELAAFKNLGMAHLVTSWYLTHKFCPPQPLRSLQVLVADL